MPKQLDTKIFLERVQAKHPEMFSRYDYSKTVYINSGTKVTVSCLEHGDFEIWPGDHVKGMSGCKHCISKKRKETNLQRYGTEQFFSRNDLIQSAMLQKHGVRNPGLLPDHIQKSKATNLKRYGVEWGANAPKVVEQRIKTNLERYGVDIVSKNPVIAQKSVRTKIGNGGFTKSNSSLEATIFIRKYISAKGYQIDQVAYADSDLHLHEWGIYHNGRWILYDLVVFERGHRGDKSKIIEILEYHGPFHYSQQDASDRGENRAYPWKSNNTTIKESYEQDMMKEQLAKSLTENYLIVSNNKAIGVDPNEVIEENVRKLESRYPGGSFDVHYSENRQEGDL